MPERQAAGGVAEWVGALPWEYILPVLVGGLLCAPCLSLGYFWDDYYFLAGRSPIAGSYLLPEPGAAFYRPIPQGIYFGLLRWIDPSASGGLAHVLNLIVLAVSIILLVRLVSQLSSPLAGAVSGLFLAAAGCVPSLVAWVSCCQDLFAIALVLAALLFRHQRRETLAFACAVAAVLSKEQAIVVFPVLVLWDRLVGRASHRQRTRIIAYVSSLVGWILIHPGIRLLMGRGFRSGATGYVGLEHPERWAHYLARSLATLVNITPFDLTSVWWRSRVDFGIGSLIVLAVGLILLPDRLRHPSDSEVSLKRIALVAAILGIPTLLAPVVLVRHWAPYFYTLPVTALAIVAGPALTRQRTTILIALLCAFLVAGVRYRGLGAGSEPLLTERLFVDAARSIARVRSEFLRTFPKFPSGSTLLVSVESTGVRGIQSTLLDAQTLKLWYRDPSLRAIPVMKRTPGLGREYLIRVTSDLQILWIDPDGGLVRTLSPDLPDKYAVVRPILNYARAVAASGETDRAIREVSALAGTRDVEERMYYRRMIAAFLLAANRQAEAGQILSSTAPFERESALKLVKRILAEPSLSETLDMASFPAFGLSASDPNAMRWIVNEFLSTDSFAQAAWYARYLCRSAPEDPACSRAIHAANVRRILPSRFP